MRYLKLIFIAAVMFVLFSPKGIAQSSTKTFVESWVTTPNRSELLEKQIDTIAFEDKQPWRIYPIIVDDNQKMQSMDGFGFALTGGSAELLMRMTPFERTKILKELFSVNSVGVSYLRLSIGASDLNSFVFSYDDIKKGETDYSLRNFSLAQDLKDVIPVMREIQKINPDIKVLGSPWSAPAWMKENADVRGGALKKECYAVYANYFVKYIQAMKNEGIAIDAITIQNEPLNSLNTPSMPWYNHEQKNFLKDYLIPTFKKNNITTKLILFDHNCDRPDYPLTLLSDPVIGDYVAGSGFHYYRGDINTMSALHNARPDKNIYFTEQMVVDAPGKPFDIAGQVKRLIIGVSRNWSKNVILWNLAADLNNDPHTDNGGCSMCQGAISIDGNIVTRNLAYYVIAHASKFVRPGSCRIASTASGEQALSLTQDEERPEVMRATLINNIQVLPNVAFKTPDGKIVLIVSNDSYSNEYFCIQYKGKYANIKLKPGCVGTYCWQADKSI